MLPGKDVPRSVLALPVALRKEEGNPLSETIYEYIAQVSETANIPLVIYQPPGLEKAYGMTPQLLRRLARLKMVRGMKYSVGERGPFMAISEVVRETDFALICGIEEFYLEAIPLGAVGLIAGGCNTHPEILYAIQCAHRDGKDEGAAKAHEDLLKAMHVFDGLDWPTAAIGYMSRMVTGVKPFTRTQIRFYDPHTIDRLAREMNRILEPYRRGD